MRRFFSTLLLLTCLSCLVSAHHDELPPGVKSTQNPKDVPPTPDEAVQAFRPMKGFNVQLFAGEPDVAQPIALTFDDRGRLWVAECYAYPKWRADQTGHDRIVILEDSDGDGKHDKRTVFADKLHNLTSIEIGYGGVWALCLPHLVFIPDRNGDDKPDAKPDVVLDGWTLKAKHNVVNGLTWGPDGWLWGRHGITAPSLVGKPGDAKEKRTELNCSIWRYHPTKQNFEVICNGTTNPWGLDFDEHGEAFFTNCVIGHLWHVIPGAHYKRMYGLDYNQFTYELIESTSDHIHWGGGKWTTSRGGKGAHDKAGGGHAHSGGMIYLGGNWPKEYHNGLFTCNIHGNRVNHDHLKRKGCGYVGTHAADILRADNLWYRGIDLDYGPDGAVYISDWVDFGECHDNDGVHRQSGRIYRVSYGKTPGVVNLDLTKKTNLELVKLQSHKNEWYARHARRILAERAATDESLRGLHRVLEKAYGETANVVHQLRVLWTLHATGGTTEAWLLKQLDHKDEHVRTWAIRLLCESKNPSDKALSKFKTMAEKDPSGLVRLYLASMLQRMPMEKRFPIATELAKHGEDAEDRCQPLMIWYGIEPAVAKDKNAALQLLAKTKIPKLRQFIARRLSEGGK